MEYITPNFTKDMVKTHKILIPNMAVTQFRLMQAALASEGYQTEVLGNCGSEVAQLGLKYVHNDTCYPALLVIGQFLASTIWTTPRCSSHRRAAAAVRPTTSSFCARHSSRRATAISPWPR